MSNGVPVWIKPVSLETEAHELVEALDLGTVGFWLDEHIFSADNTTDILQKLRSQVHKPVGV
jgi:hypothetical protein